MTSHIFRLFSFVLLSTVALAPFNSFAEPKKEEQKPVSEQNTTPSPPLNSQMFDSILDLIKKDYVEEVTDDKLLAGALNGMLGALDPHSSYMDPKTYASLKSETKGEFGGLGMEVTMENGLVKIISPMDDTPAQKEGLEAGDLIVAIDKKPVFGMTLQEAVDLLHGEAGTKVRIHIKRKDKDVFEKTITRAIIHVKAVKWRLEGNIGYIRISTFNEATVSLIKEAMADIKKKLGDKLEGLILDVRNDPGGLLDAAIGATDLFLNKGQEIVSTRGRNLKIDSRAYADGQDIAEGIPIVVLINGGSASASEILAGALQDNHRAIVVGTKSFGKGSVQVVLPLTNKGAIRLTMARYYTPSGRSIQAKGIEPDIVIEQEYLPLEKVNENDRIHEEDIMNALDTQKAKKSEANEKPKTKEQEKQEEEDKLDPEKQKKKKEMEDYQLKRALDIVQAIAIKQKYDIQEKK